MRFPLVVVIMAFAKERIRHHCLFFGADEILDAKETHLRDMLGRTLESESAESRSESKDEDEVEIEVDKGDI